MRTAEDPRPEIADRTADLLAWAAAAMAPAGVAADDIAARLAASSEGGKAFRGRLLLAAFDGCDGTDREAALGLAAALELFQTAALLHDDVLDGSDTRRGRPAAHKVFEAQHRDAGWQGDAAAYGRSGAILAGDVALIAAQRGATLAARRAGDGVADLFDEMAALVTAGQHLDMRVAVSPVAALPGLHDEIRTIMRAKTASYTAEFPLALGAAAAGAPAATVAALRAAGLPLGIAFQLRDDVLGLTGAPERTGKPVGDDLREGKRTLLVWHGVTHGSGAQRDAVLAVLGRADAGEDEIRAAIDAVAASGALDAVEEQIALDASRARDALTAALPDPAAVLALVGAAVDRSA
ncbi:polyprenyl synthetase family protein [Demequina sp. SYSU T00192]|uniref:Polyprenyl synthetase family protein n=1 Tax=Demequina litoralis TaxID=3051660 RepID=A0ABT8G623_9MICO|nr:polyprenyl synthetase family protein [Demequina sp. SYSU T00192]MDN4474584.1 polyprenyl synthetase family protein [Demequina sp. SYSU T00192]